MFKSLGLFAGIPCPALKCSGYGCLFDHSRQTIEPERPSKRQKVADVANENVSAVLRSGSQQVVANKNVNKQNGLKSAPAAVPDASTVSSKALPDVKGKPARQVVVTDPRYVARKTQTQDISIPYEPTVPVPHKSRLHYLRAYKAQFERIYAPLAAHEDYMKWVDEDSIAQEKAVLQRSGKGIYKQAARNMLLKFQKRAVSVGVEDRGIFPDYKPPLPTPDLSTLVHSTETLKKAGFLTSIPEPDATMQNEEGHDRLCDRCGQRFIVSASPSEWSTCTYHPGKSSRLGKSGVRARQWSCCTTEGPGCVVAKSHVFKVSFEPRLAAFHPFIRLPAATSDKEHLKIVALDCEMVYTTASMELARVVFTDVAGRVILDEYVQPENTILDLNTRFSGIKEGDLTLHGITRTELFEKLGELGVTCDTVMIGHGLENDLSALRIVHDRLVDSAILFPHKAGLPYRNALKYLVKRYLAKDIQMNPINGQDAAGHDPAEDARSALELVVWKAINGDKKIGDEPFNGKLK